MHVNSDRLLVAATAWQYDTVHNCENLNQRINQFRHINKLMIDLRAGVDAVPILSGERAYAVLEQPSA